MDGGGVSNEAALAAYIAGAGERTRKGYGRNHPEMGFASARLTLDLSDGRRLAETVPVAKGHPDNPIGWNEMRAKFDVLVRPLIGVRTESLFGLVRQFGGGGALDEIRAILGQLK